MSTIYNDDVDLTLKLLLGAYEARLKLNFA